MIVCKGCETRMTKDHEFAHGEPVHIDNDSRWCTVPDGAFHSPNFGMPMILFGGHLFPFHQPRLK